MNRKLLISIVTALAVVALAALLAFGSGARASVAMHGRTAVVADGNSWDAPVTPSPSDGNSWD